MLEGSPSPICMFLTRVNVPNCFSDVKKSSGNDDIAVDSRWKIDIDSHDEKLLGSAPAMDCIQYSCVRSR